MLIAYRLIRFGRIADHDARCLFPLAALRILPERPTPAVDEAVALADWAIEWADDLCHNLSMDKRSVISKLREHEPELRAAGVVHLRLFGSVARGDANATSDVDLMAEFDTKKKLTLLDMVGLENRLSELLQVKVDLTPANTMKQQVRATADHEAVLAF
jgi:uncharacterized protein